MRPVLIVLCLALSACGIPLTKKNAPPQVVVVNQVLCQPAPIDKVELEKITWVAVQGQELKDSKPTGEPSVWFALSSNDYAALSRNVALLLQQTRQLLSVVSHYKKCIDASNDSRKSTPNLATSNPASSGSVR